MDAAGNINSLVNSLSEALGPELWFSIVVAIVILILTAIACRLLTKLTRKLVEKREAILPATIFVNISRVTIWTIGLCVMFPVCFNINLTAIIAALGIGGVALSLGLQGTISNIMGGLQLAVLNIIRIGDFVEYDGQQGVVEDISWRQTTIKALEGDTILVPNSLINSESIKVMPPIREIRLKVHVPYQTVMLRKEDGGLDELAKQMIEALESRLTAPRPEGLGLELERKSVVLFRESGEYTVTATVKAWIADCEEFNRVEVEDTIMRACAPVGAKGYVDSE